MHKKKLTLYEVFVCLAINTLELLFLCTKIYPTESMQTGSGIDHEHYCAVFAVFAFAASVSPSPMM